MEESARRRSFGGHAVGALIMLGTLFGLIVLIFALVLRYDPEAGDPPKERSSQRV
jgi:hypothetical protein